MKRSIIHVISRNQRNCLAISTTAIEVDPTCEILQHKTNEEFRESLKQNVDLPWQVAVTDQIGLVNVRTLNGQHVPVVLVYDRDGCLTEEEKLTTKSVGLIRVEEVKQHLQEAIFIANLFQKLSSGVDRLAELNDRERSIVSLAADGIPNKSIAKRLNVSIKTIEQCRRNAYHKLGIKSSAEVGSLVTFGRFYSILKGPSATSFTPTSS